MKNILLSLVFLIGVSQLFAQSLYHRAKIDLSKKDIRQLAALGIETDHGKIAKGRFIENDYSENEIEKIRNAGFKVEILINDVSSYYANQLSKDLNKSPESCFGEDLFSKYKTPDHFILGSMGGYYTYQEMLDILDDMQSEYPNLISIKKEISTTYTHEGRPIYSVVISDNPSEDESDEPKTLYTALHHAREPGSLSQMIYFMWYMLENYETNSLVKGIIDNTQLHFIPCINPDGYVYNEMTDPNGGGLWRKNRRNNGDGTTGVDLNRNYGYEWAHDDIGSSDLPESDIYRGPAAFSEPETSAVKEYCEKNNFNFILNYHTFGNLLIYPWGFSDSPTPEHSYFVAISEELVKLNGYLAGTGSETVGYVVNGDSDDWMYGEQTTKSKAYTLTPEVGLEGFWPPISSILSNCKENIQANISFGGFNLNFPVITLSEPEFTDVFEGEIEFSIKQLGLIAEGFTIEISPGSNNISIGKEGNYLLQTLDAEIETTPFTINPNTKRGETFAVAYSVTTDEINYTDTIKYIFNGNINEIEVSLEEFGEGILWEPDNIEWFYSTDVFTSPEFALSDSPAEYLNNENKSIYSKEIMLPENSELELRFNLKVDIEENYDYAQLYLIDESNIAHVLCGKYSTKGTEFQAFEQPVYDGSFDWVTETIDISEWSGQNVSFLWKFVSDQFLTLDGFYVDDWSIYNIQELVNNNKNELLAQRKIYPNPAQNIIYIDEAFDKIEQLYLYDSMGKLIYQGKKSNTISTEQFGNGVYHLLIKYTDNSSQNTSVIIQK